MYSSVDRSTACALFAAVVICLLPLGAHARVDITPKTAPTQNLTWSGGTVVVVQDFCVQSTQSPQPHATDPTPYLVEVAGPFDLQNGTRTIAATLEWVDLSTNTATVLSPDTPTAETMTGQTQNCPGGNNGRLRLTYTEADILSAGSGVFTQSYQLAARNSGKGRSQDTSSLTVELTVPGSILISQVDDIDLGSYSGTDMQASDSLCVYQTAGASYAISALGSGPSGSFAISNGSVDIPLHLSWDDGISKETLAPGAILSGRTSANSGSASCNSGAANNATLEVTIMETDILANNVSAGSYSGTLTLIVELE